MPHTDRRAFLALCSSLGVGSTLLPGVVWSQVAEGREITAETIRAAEEIAGIALSDAERELMVSGVRRQVAQIGRLHRIPLDNAVPPAVTFAPHAPGIGASLPTPEPGPAPPAPPVAAPASTAPAELAFASVGELGALLRAGRVTSVELTRLALDRLEQHDPVLHCTITRTADRALAQARAADEALARGDDRGPLHGIPWGAKDLLAVRGYPTTWGSGAHRDQVIDEDATVVRRLDTAGAVLVAKLTLGELAQGDRWYGERTRNPWNPEQGSSGSSAGSASATAAGLVPFTLGTETLGSISSPSTRCGVTGLRPTFGRVPRTGAMALSWTMDKIGPITRHVADAAHVFAAIHGADGADPSAVDAPFAWEPGRGLEGLRVGYVADAFALPERDPENPSRTIHPTKAFDDAALDVLRGLGVTLSPVALPAFDYGALRIILTAEASAAFDALVREDRDDLLIQQQAFAWPNTFRTARFIPAVDYINANRARTLAMRAWAELFREVDVIVTPTSAAGLSQLVATNFTGHPAVILPHGFREDGTPVSLTFLGNLFDEGRLLRVADAFQGATDHHRRRPAGFA